MSSKLQHYKDLYSLQLYLLVDSRQQRVFGYYALREGQQKRWELSYFEAGDNIPIPCTGGSIAYEAIYEGVSLSA
ncbi:MAG: hypothetical protein R2880_14105 [Deinococcales bacterium]